MTRYHARPARRNRSLRYALMVVAEGAVFLVSMAVLFLVLTVVTP